MTKAPLSPNLDILRAIAVLCVFIDHVGIIGFRMSHPAVANLGLVGVLLFFVHTCFVLLMSLDRQPGTARFYVRRVFRIYPLAIFAVVMAAATERHSWGEVFSNLALVQNLTGHGDIAAVLWSLPWEVQMYVTLPVVFWAVRRFGRGGVLLLWAASIPLAWFVPLAVYAPCFLGGAVAFSFLRYRKSAHWCLWPIALIAILPITVVAIGAGYVNVAAYTLCLSMGLLIPLFAPAPDGVIARAAAVIAKYSYGIYLFHVPAMVFAFRSLALPYWASVPLAIAMSGAFSVALYHAIEHPFIELGKRLTERRKRAESMKLAVEAAA